jgi:hypothetical protein
LDKFFGAASPLSLRKGFAFPKQLKDSAATPPRRSLIRKARLTESQKAFRKDSGKAAHPVRLVAALLRCVSVVIEALHSHRDRET